MATATTTALGQAAGTDTRHSAQNVRYKMKFNSSTGQWEQEQIMTPLVQTIYPGIRTKEGKTKDVTTGAIVGEPTTTAATTTTTPAVEPEVTPMGQMTDGTSTTGLGGYQQVQQQYQQPTPSTTGGIRYEETQTRGVSESQQDRMKYNVMPGGLNLRSGAQNFSLSQSHGLINDLVNPKPQEETEKKESKFKLPGMLGVAANIAGTMIQPRSEKLQITKMIESGSIRVRDEKTGNILSNEEAIQRLTQDENGRTKILKGQDLINSGLKVDQIKHLSKNYAQSASFMHFEEDLINNFSAPNGNKLITLNPVQGISGTKLFGILKDPIGASGTAGEQVLVVDADGGGGYTSDGKFVGMNGQVYAFGTAEQAMQSANAGHLTEATLARMTNEDGSLKNLYNPDVNDFVGGLYKVDTSNEDLFKKVGDKWYYTGNVVMEETKDIKTNGGNGDIIGNTQDEKREQELDQRREQELKDAREAQEARERLKAIAEKEEPQEDTWQPRDQGDGKPEPVREKAERKTCFHPEQLVGNKLMKDLQPGDFINGIEILGMVKLKLNEDMYSINDVKVTGSHKVKFNNNWIYVSNHPDSFRINDKPEFVYVPIVKGGIFNINNNEFADYDDENIETLDNKLKAA
jgi:hypothetical protein